MEQLYGCLSLTVLVSLDLFQGATVVYSKQNTALWKKWQLLDLTVASSRTCIPRTHQGQHHVISVTANPADSRLKQGCCGQWSLGWYTKGFLLGFSTKISSETSYASSQSMPAASFKQSAKHTVWSILMSKICLVITSKCICSYHSPYFCGYTESICVFCRYTNTFLLSVDKVLGKKAVLKFCYICFCMSSKS